MAGQAAPECQVGKRSANPTVMTAPPLGRGPGQQRPREGVRLEVQGPEPGARQPKAPGQRGHPATAPQSGALVWLCRVASARWPPALGLGGQACARSFPTCHPRAPHHTRQQCAYEGSLGSQGEAVRVWSRLVSPPKAVLGAAGGVQGQPDGSRKHSSRLSCEADNESPDLESLSQRDLSRMLTAQGTVLPNKRCKRVT